MSIVPSEIEYQNDSDAQVETARISGLTVFVMLAVLAAGFASVGYLAFDELNGDSVVLAQAPEQTDDFPSDADVLNETPPAQVESDKAEPAVTDENSAPTADENDAPPVTNDAILDDGSEFVVAQLPPSTDEPRELAPPLAKGPSPAPPPTVMYDPAVFDDLPEEAGDVTAPAEEPQSAPAETSSTEPETVETNVNDAPPIRENPAPDAAPSPVDVVDIAPEDDAPPEIPEETQTDIAPVEATPPADEPAPPPAVETAPAPTPATVDALAGSHVVQLASYRSEAEATADWGRIETRLGAYLAGKTYQIERADLGDRGVFFRLRIGPFTSSDEAQSYCAGLKERGQDCLALRR